MWLIPILFRTFAVVHSLGRGIFFQRNGQTSLVICNTEWVWAGGWLAVRVDSEHRAHYKTTRFKTFYIGNTQIPV